MQENANNDNNNVSMEQFDVIDISNDSIMQSILHDAIGNKCRGSDEFFCMLRFRKVHNGTMIKITQCKDTVLNTDMYFDGCILFNGCKVLVRGDDSHKIQFADPSEKVMIYRRKGVESNNQKETLLSYYYILNDIYAKLCPPDGWIWSDGKPDN